MTQTIPTIMIPTTSLEQEKGNESQLENRSDSFADEMTALDPAVTKSLLRKLDLRILPMLALLFLCSFLDR